MRHFYIFPLLFLLISCGTEPEIEVNELEYDAYQVGGWLMTSDINAEWIGTDEPQPSTQRAKAVHDTLRFTEPNDQRITIRQYAPGETSWKYDHDYFLFEYIDSTITETPDYRSGWREYGLTHPFVDAGSGQPIIDKDRLMLIEHVVYDCENPMEWTGDETMEFWYEINEHRRIFVFEIGDGMIEAINHVSCD